LQNSTEWCTAGTGHFSTHPPELLRPQLYTSSLGLKQKRNRYVRSSDYTLLTWKLKQWKQQVGRELHYKLKNYNMWEALSLTF